MGSSAPEEALVVLTVEDNPAEVRLLAEAFSTYNQPVRHLIASNITEALDALHAREGYDGSPTPDIIMLDIDLPGPSGIDILTEIRATTDGETIPVIMYSSTSDPETIRTCYRRGANAYVVKPDDYDEIELAVEQILSFWGETANISLAV